MSKIELTDEQIDQIVKETAVGLGDSAATVVGNVLRRSFGQKTNPYEVWRGKPLDVLRLVPDLFHYAAKVADSVYPSGHYPDAMSVKASERVTSDLADLKRIIAEIRTAFAVPKEQP